MNITYSIKTETASVEKLVVDGVEKDVNRIKYTFTPNNGLTEKHFFFGDHHGDWELEECKRQYLKRFYDDWLEEAGYSLLYYTVDQNSGLVSELNKITDSDQVTKWRKPNAFQEVPATTVGEI